jgi:DNA polymerase III epsilon subunit-like protein
MSYDPKQVAFVDTETAGLHPDKHPIWQIAVIVDGEEHVWHQQMFGGQQNWQRWVDPFIVETNMNHILDDYDPAKALTAKTSTDTFVELVRGRHIVGCNPRFDVERIHRTWRAFHQADWEEPWNYHLIDVEGLMLGYLASQADHDWYAMDMPTLPWKSRELARAVGVDPDAFEPKHSALADARFAKACFEAVMGGPT